MSGRCWSVFPGGGCPDLDRLARLTSGDRRRSTRRCRTCGPRGVRAQLIGLIVCLASSIDLIPDVIPVLGCADDALIAALRLVTRHAGATVIE